MIKFLSSWIEGVAIAVIIASIFEMLLPNGNIKKYVKIVLGVYVVFSIISPFVNSEALYNLNISDSIDKYAENIESNTTTEQSQETDVEDMYIQAFEKEITSTVEKQGYNVSKCTVNAILDTDSKNAGIQKIDIILDSKNSNIEETGENNQTSENSSINTVEIEEVKINVSNNTTSNSTTTGEITEKDINKLKKYLSEYYEVDKKIINIQKR